MVTIIWLVLIVLLAVVDIHAGTWWWRRDRRGQEARSVEIVEKASANPGTPGWQATKKGFYRDVACFPVGFRRHLY